MTTLDTARSPVSSKRIAVFGIALALVLGGCFRTATPAADDSSKGSPPKVLNITATVVRVELEGGFWGLVADDGARYDPVDLPSEFRQPGLRVQIRARLEEPSAGFHMWGTRIVILESSRL